MNNVLRLRRGDDEDRPRSLEEDGALVLRPETEPPAEQHEEAESGSAEGRAQVLDTRTRHEGAEQLGTSQDDAVMVDPPHRPTTVLASVLAEREIERRPVIPAVWRNWHQLKSAARWVALHYGHTVAFHGLRSPAYAARLLLRSPKGLRRSVVAVADWWSDAEGRPLRHEAVRANDPKAYMTLSRQRQDRMRWRSWLAIGLGTVVLAVLVAVLIWGPPVLIWWLVLGAVVAVLGRLGTDPDRPVAGHAVTAHEAPRLTSTMITAALGSLGVAQINRALGKGGEGINFPAPITRDGEGWRADIDLPLGVTALDVAEKREGLASGLRRPVGAVWPEADPSSHAGRLILWVGDKSMSKAKQPPWPLAKSGTADLFKPLPYGFDQRGRLVTLSLMFSNLLLGSIPRQGKTFAVRVVALAAALDPNVELHVGELKGTGDLDSVESSSHRYASGPADDATLRKVMDSLREVFGYLEVRSRTISKLPRDLVPENKVTPIVSGKRELGLWPVLVVIDECQELFESEYGKEAEYLCKAIIKRGPAMGVMLVLATQRPDKSALPTAISANMGIRLSLKVMDQVANDMILGTGAYKAGMNAALLTEDDKGVGYLRDGGGARVVRSAYIAGEEAERIGARARAQREAAGTLTGHAAGQDYEVVVISVLDDVRDVFRPGETGLWNELILERLRELRPGHYDEWQAAQLTASLKAAGITGAGRQVERRDDESGARKNKRGVYLNDLQAALEAAPEPSDD